MMGRKPKAATPPDTEDVEVEEAEQDPGLPPQKLPVPKEAIVEYLVDPDGKIIRIKAHGAWYTLGFDLTVADLFCW
jgi:hypothetical protein